MTDKKFLWRLIGFTTVLLIVLFDQLSKWLIMTEIFEKAYRDTEPDLIAWLFAISGPIDHPPVKVTDFFNLVMVWNPGISFGMLQMGTVTMSIVLTVFALVICIGFMTWVWREPRPTLAFPIGLIVGGALGNVWDRVRFGAVADFFDVHVAGYHWPAFNVADSAITIGVLLLLIDQFILSRKPSQGD
jgi:signal peptidase II